MATWGALGCNLGSVLAYEIGYFGGRPLVERYGRYIFLSHRELNIADRFFERRGSIAVLIARLLPVIRTFIALPAGIARMPRLKFHIYTFIGSWPWCFMLAYIGMRLGERWDKDPRLKMWFHRLDAVILGVIVLAVVYFVWSHVQHRVGRGGRSCGLAIRRGWRRMNFGRHLERSRRRVCDAGVEGPLRPRLRRPYGTQYR